MAKLKARVANLDNLDESLRGFYREEGEGFVLDVEPDPSGWDLQNVQGLKNAHNEQSELRRKRTEERDALQARFEEQERQLERLKKRKHDEPDTQKAIEDALATRDAEWQSKFDTQTETFQKQITRRDSEVYGFAVENRALAALKKAEATDEGLDLLMPHVQKRLRMRRDSEDQLHVDVLDGNGNPAIGASPSEPATLEQIITAEFKAKYPSAFKGTEHSGSGASGDRRPSVGNPNKITPEQAGSMDMAEYRKARAEGRL